MTTPVTALAAPGSGSVRPARVSVPVPAWVSVPGVRAWRSVPASGSGVGRWRWFRRWRWFGRWRDGSSDGEALGTSDGDAVGQGSAATDEPAGDGTTNDGTTPLGIRGRHHEAGRRRLGSPQPAAHEDAPRRPVRMERAVVEVRRARPVRAADPAWAALGASEPVAVGFHPVVELGLDIHVDDDVDAARVLRERVRGARCRR